MAADAHRTYCSSPVTQRSPSFGVRPCGEQPRLARLLEFLEAGAASRFRGGSQARALGLETSDDLSTTDLADSASDLYQQEFDESRLEQLREQLAALERAEQRLADGQYGRSVESVKSKRPWSALTASLSLPQSSSVRRVTLPLFNG